MWPHATPQVAAEIDVAVLSVETGGAGSTVLARARCSFAEGEVVMPSAQPDDTALFLHTSGTTGKPKGVPLSHANMLTTMQNVTDTYELKATDKSYLVSCATRP